MSSQAQSNPIGKPPPPAPRPKPTHLSQSSNKSQFQAPKPTRKKGLGWPWDSPANHFPLYSSFNSSTISWLFNWELWVPPGLPQTIEWVPCVRTAEKVHDILPFLTDITNTNPNIPVIKNFLGFNEPDIESQANLTPAKAAELWAQYILPAKQKFGFRLGSPGMSSDTSKSVPWLDEFLFLFMPHSSSQLADIGADTASGLRKWAAQKAEIDFLVVHWYGGRFGDMKDFLYLMHERYGLPVWVNEFACSNMGHAQGETGEGEVEAFLREGIPWLESTEWIEKYAYFGIGQGSEIGGWVGRKNNFTEIAGDSSCEETGGRRLSKTGKLYLEL